VEVVRRLSINMPLLDALQVPTYSRYFKDILANKYEIATLGVNHVKMFKQCSSAIVNGLEKQKDPGCPTIPCSVGSFKFEKALCNLGASMSAMPRDVFEKATVVWTSLGPLPRWVLGPTTRWAPGTSRLVPHGT
jgi:hypothetical protein